MTPRRSILGSLHDMIGRMKKSDSWVLRGMRWGWRSILMPNRVTEALLKLDNVQAALGDLRRDLAADSLGNAGQAQRSNCTPPEQIYRGHSDADLTLFERFSKVSPEPAEGFLTDFLGVRTRTTFLSGFDAASGAVFGIPVPGDGFHAEAIEWIGLLKSVASARDRYTAMEPGAGRGP